MAKGSKMAEKIRSNVDRVRKQSKTDLKSVPPHRHCVICRSVIRIESIVPINQESMWVVCPQMVQYTSNPP